MPMTRRHFLASTSIAGAAFVWPETSLSSVATNQAEPEVADNGLFAQPWFLDSFLELNEDLSSTAEAGKHLAVLFEQRGCPYCRELHAVNFANKDIRSYLDANFQIIQLDMWGSREVTDFDGQALPEKQLAQRWAVNFTPTMVFFPNTPAAVKGKIGKQAEIARMPGYFKPFHFLSMLEYVHDGAYAKQHFQRFLQDKFKKLEAQGKKPSVW